MRMHTRENYVRKLDLGGQTTVHRVCGHSDAMKSEAAKLKNKTTASFVKDRKYSQLRANRGN
jgi:hypothetical protein